MLDDSQVKFILDDVERAMPGRGISTLLGYLYQQNKKLSEEVDFLKQQLPLKPEQDYSTQEQDGFSRGKN